MKLLPQLRSKWAGAAAGTGHETQWIGNSQGADDGDEFADDVDVGVNVDIDEVLICMGVEEWR